LIGEPDITYGKANPELAEELRKFADDHLWVYENREGLLDQYPEQWVAVKDRRVIASDPDFERLLSKIPDRAHTCVEFVGRESLEIIV
jgi:hypothetical protein